MNEFIKAKIILDSVSAVTGSRLTTFEIEYPRIIHSELMTHRMLSRNAASSRAIPFDKMLQQLNGIPSRFGQANKGMQDKLENYVAPINLQGKVGEYEYGSMGIFKAWEYAKQQSIIISKAIYEAGYHKQIYNRLTEPFQIMKTVVSATEWNNFFWLRCDEAADPTIAELAFKMKEVYDASVPQVLQTGEWHLPFVNCWYDWARKEQNFEIIENEKEYEKSITLEEAIKVSCARTCAVSFRNVDYGLEKSEEVYQKLISDSKIHGSALEHAAKVMEKHLPFSVNHPTESHTWEKGISHVDRDGNLWSANFKGFIQHRKTIEGENHER